MVSPNPFSVSVPDPLWFVLFVRSNQEKQTAFRLADREVEHFLPCYPSLRQWKDRRVMLDMPLFPGYIFVRLPLLDRAKVLTLPNVLCLVGSRTSPSVVSEEEIASIKRGREHGNAEPHPYLTSGQQVLIVSGALSGMQGILLRKRNNTRVVVSINSIGRSFVVETDMNSIKPLWPREPARQAV